MCVCMCVCGCECACIMCGCACVCVCQLTIGACTKNCKCIYMHSGVCCMYDQEFHMQPYILAYAYMHACTHPPKVTHLHTYICPNTHLHTCVWCGFVHACLRGRLGGHVGGWACLCVYVCLCLCMCVCVCPCLKFSVRVCMCNCANKYVSVIFNTHLTRADFWSH